MLEAGFRFADEIRLRLIMIVLKLPTITLYDNLQSPNTLPLTQRK